MSLGNVYQVVLWRAVTQIYQGIIFALIKNRSASGIQWESFQRDLARWMFWVDITSAAALRYRATHERTMIPPAHDDIAPHLIDVAKVNPWYGEHRLTSHPLIEGRAAWIRQAEESYLTRKVDTLRALITNPATRDRLVPIYRLDRQRREAYGEISNTSEQIQLAQPEISDSFPCVEYHTRDDNRVRPSHYLMQGFIASRAWEGWPRTRPLNGWGCRCYLRYVARFEARERGYLNSYDEMKFDVRWPNTLSQRNYESGVFPDHGWHGPKQWAFPGQMMQKVA